MTVAGKILTMGYAIFYVPLFLYVMTVLFQSRLEKLRIADERIEKEVQHVEKDVEIILDEVTHESSDSNR
jgi:sensor domain CHASE-containing protein